MSWALLAFAGMVAMAVVAASLQRLVSDSATAVALCAGIAATFFCLAGCAITLYRQYVILPEARRLAQRGAHDESRIALGRTLPPNSSVILQAAVGICAAVIAAVNM